MWKLFWFMFSCLIVVQESKAVSFDFTGACDQNQIFGPGRTYTYNYEGVAEVGTPLMPSVIKIKCNRVEVSIYRSCSARMHLFECSVSERENPEGPFQVSNKQRKFVNRLQRSSLYFHFNNAEVFAVLHHKNEQQDTLNIKKAIFSHLMVQMGENDNYVVTASTSGRTIRRRVIESDRNENSASIKTDYLRNGHSEGTRFRLPNIELINQLKNITLGYKKVYEFAARKMLTRFSFSSENCTYIFQERTLQGLVCEEYYNDFIQTFFYRNELLENMIQKTSVSLTLQTNERSNKKQRSSSRERIMVGRNFISDSLIYSSKMLTNEKNSLMTANFDPAVAVEAALSDQLPGSTPIYSRIEHWVVQQDASSLEDAWTSIEHRLSLQQLENAKKLWIDMLLSCSSQKWCQDDDDCIKRFDCQTALARIYETSFANDRSYIMSKVSEIAHPTIRMLSTLLWRTPKSQQNADWMIATSVLITNHMRSDLVKTSMNIVSRAANNIFDTIEELFQQSSYNDEDLAEIEAAFISMSFLYANHTDRARQVLSLFWENVYLQNLKDKDVMIAFIRSVARSNLMKIPSERSRILSLIHDETQSYHVRLTSFLEMIVGHLTEEEVAQIVLLAENQGTLTDYMRNFMKAQLSLHSVGKSLLAPDTLNLLSQSYQVDEIKRVKYNENFDLELFGINDQLSISLISYYSSNFMDPQVIGVHFEFVKSKLKLFDMEVQLGGIRAYMDNIFAHQNVFPKDAFKQFMSASSMNWIKSWLAGNPVLSESMKKRITSVKNQLNFFQMLNDLSSPKFYSIKLFGEKVELSSLPKLTSGQVFQLLKNLESGLKFEKSFYCIPLMMRSSMFTSIGVPFVTNIDITAVIKPKIQSVFEMTKLYFSGFSKVDLKMLLESILTVTYGKSMNLFRDVSAAKEVTLGIQGAVQTSLKLRTTPSSLIASGQFGGSKTFVAKAIELSKPWSTATGFANPGYFCKECGNCVKDSLYQKRNWNSCLPLDALKFDLSLNKGVFSLLDSALGNGFSVEINLKYPYQEDFNLFIVAAQNILNSNIEIKSSINHNAPVTLRVAKEIIINEEASLVIDKLSISCELFTMMTSLATVNFTMKKNDSETALQYDIISTVETSFGTILYSLEGIYRQAPDDNFSLMLQAESIDALTSFIYKTENFTFEGIPGKNLTLSLTSTRKRVRRPTPTEITFFFTRVNSADYDRYYKIIHLSISEPAWFEGAPFIIDGRMQMEPNAVSDTLQPIEYNWHATISLFPILQGEFNVSSRSTDSATVAFKLYSLNPFQSFKLDYTQLNDDSIRNLVIKTLRVQQVVHLTSGEAPESLDDSSTYVISTNPDCNLCVGFYITNSPYLSNFKFYNNEGTASIKITRKDDTWEFTYYKDDGHLELSPLSDFILKPYADNLREQQVRFIDSLVTQLATYFTKQIQEMNYMQGTSESNMREILQRLKNIFEKIYLVEDMIADRMSKPISIKEVQSAYQSLKYRLVQFNYHMTSLMPHQGAAFVTMRNGQFITMNGQYHNIPRIPRESCSWLASTDITEGALNVIMKRDSTIYTIGDETIEIMMDGRARWSANQDSEPAPTNFPFFFKLVTCSKPSVNVIECRGLFSHARFVYYPQTGVTTIYGDMRGGATENILGSIGFPFNKTEVPQRPLPNGENAETEGQFLNAYELSEGPECLYSTEQESNEFLGLDNNSEFCNDAFQPFLKFVKQGSLSVEKLNSYISACSLSVETYIDTCQYTDMLSFSLRKLGLYCESDPKCLTCGSIEPVETTAEKFNVLFIVSLSQNSGSMNSVQIIENIMDSLDRKMNAGTDLTYSVIIYGGMCHAYPPYMLTYNYHETASDKQTVLQRLSTLLFNGPAFNVMSSIKALKFASKAFQDTHEGTIRNIILITPQENDIQANAYTELNSEQFLNTFTKISLISTMSLPDETVYPAIQFFQTTGGDCYETTETGRLVNDIKRNIDDISGARISCSCFMSDLSTGQITANCNLIN